MLMTVPDAAMMPASVFVFTPDVPNGNEVAEVALTAVFVAVAALATDELPAPLEAVDEVVDGTDTVGSFVETFVPVVETDGIVTFGAPDTGMVGMLGNNGIELYLFISQFMTAIAPCTADVIAPMIPPMMLMTPPAIFPTMLRAAPRVFEITGAT